MTPGGLRAPFGALAYGVTLALVWVLLWGAWSPANVLSGVVVAAALIVWLVPRSRRRAGTVHVRPLAIVRLGLFLVRQLAVSNYMVAREVITPRTRLRTGVVAIPLRDCSEQVITTLANLIAMAPGTMPVEVKDDWTEMYVHIFHLHDVETVRQELLELRNLTVRALGSPAALAGIEEEP